MRRLVVFLIMFLLFSTLLPAQQTNNIGGINLPLVDVSVRQPDTNRDMAFSLQLLILLTVLSLAPSLMVIMTSFLRVSIVLDFVKRALNLQQVPPSSVLMGISLFITLFIMWPTFEQMYEQAYRPFVDEEITVEEMFDRGVGPLRYFMYKQVKDNPENIALFMNLQGLDQPETFADVPTYVLIPAFILNELKIAFQIGILIYIPFIVIDMVVASILMSMGMIMLPPVMISMPFKLILFVMVDGWSLLTRQLIASFM
jgi:flagellar biosynthesis protein FliP